MIPQDGDFYAHPRQNNDPIEVSAEFTKLHRDGEITETRIVTLQLREGERDYVWMTGGPTGYESFALDEWRSGDWCACAGTVGSWARCIVPAAEMTRAVAILLAERAARGHNSTSYRSSFTTRVGRHLGLPFRDRRDEDRAVEARRGARAIRSVEFTIYLSTANRDAAAFGRTGSPLRSPILIEFLRDLARFVPRYERDGVSR